MQILVNFCSLSKLCTESVLGFEKIAFVLALETTSFLRADLYNKNEVTTEQRLFIFILLFSEIT